MKKFDAYNLVKIMDFIPAALRDVLEKYDNKVCLAGGCIRSIINGEEVKDWDLFITTGEPAFAHCIAGFLLSSIKNSELHETANALTISSSEIIPIQIITRWIQKDAEEVINTFDFTIAQAAIWWDGVWKSCHADMYFADLEFKRLRYTSPVREEDCAGSMMRVIKFVARGYKIPKEQLAKVIGQVVKGSTITDGMLQDEINKIIHAELCKAVGGHY